MSITVTSKTPVDDPPLSLKRSVESYGLLDLYSSEAFLTVLQTPGIFESFATFLQSEHSSENITFWTRCERYKVLQKELYQELYQELTEMETEHMLQSSSKEINVSPKGRSECLRHVEILKKAMNETQRRFEKLQKEVELMMWRDSYPRFLKHHLALYARQSPSRSSIKSVSFKGLGECFCLTDPRYPPQIFRQCSKPDDPIVLCSDAFIQATGYPSSKIFNRNCRFLQGTLSDRETVGRIRTALQEGRESTEVFLNYHLDRTPFWNLLLIAPLKDKYGNIRYHLGAQVDVSSLFSRNNDLSAMLSRDFAESPPATTPVEEKPTRRPFFRRLSEKTKVRPVPIVSSSVGLEEEVVRDDITSIGEQVEVFRSAYTRYLLVDRQTGCILLLSERARELFSGDPVSQPIFPLLTQTFSNLDSRTIRSLQRAYSSEQPISIRIGPSQASMPVNESIINLSLVDEPQESPSRSRRNSNQSSSTESSQPSIGRQKSGESGIVAIHLTPLRNEKGKVEMFVFILARKYSD